MEEVKNETLRNCHCPGCKRLTDAATSLHNGAETPEAGDYTFCLYCKTCLVYTGEPDDLSLRFASNVEAFEAVLLARKALYGR